MFCIEFENAGSVNTQEACQVLCEAKDESECVGISYSHKIGRVLSCYLCKADRLRPAGNEYGFYRRTGIFKTYFSEI